VICSFSLVSKLYIKLLDFPLSTELAKENAFCAWTFALFIQVARLEFFLDRDVLFFGTAILFIKLNIITLL